MQDFIIAKFITYIVQNTLLCINCVVVAKFAYILLYRQTNIFSQLSHRLFILNKENAF